MIIHTVRENETVYSIAYDYGLNPQSVIAANALDYPDDLVVGQTLVLLFPQISHTVSPGETIYSIARAYGTDVLSLYRNNYGLGGQPNLYPGQVLAISYGKPEYGRTIRVGGYAYPFVDRDLLRAQLPYISTLSVFSYGFTAEGELIPVDDAQLIRLAYEYRAAPLLTLTPLDENQQFNSGLISIVLRDEAAQANLIENILAAIEDRGYAGLDLDFEYIAAADRDLFTNFATLLGEELRSRGYLFHIALAPKTYDNQPGVLYEGLDYQALGEAAERAFIMTYEWGYTYGPPMAVAPILNVEQVMQYALTRIPAEKLLMGVPNYGYDWPLPYISGQTMARSISNVQAVDIAREYRQAIQYDLTSQAPFFGYTNNQGTDHVVWFEDAASIAAKLQLVEQLQLDGIVYWALMRPFPQNWLVLNSLYNIEKFA